MNASERALLNASTWLVALSGGGYFYMKYLMTGDDPFSVIHHPLQPHALALHVLLAPVLVFALGLVTREHIIGSLLEPRRRRGRVTGIVALSLAVPMIVSGYLMQVLTDPAARRVLSGIHAGGGALYALMFLGHLAGSSNGSHGANGDGGGRPGGRRRTGAMP
ncbi:MAG: hypothetical protein HYS34_06910 [Acidobacteria bacterium]|nr:hypothetical protein [Acidobacteriota bacterium]